ncbi:alpha/beta hydrolase [Sphingomonas parva]|uniref:Alpha/beta hydrolase n=1 Tax=Sphingomonas parva TaxID=2555898 RepID=A0A4Y8ZX83_9SPHN|nr:alpha/beta hydrolase [Sphingomonas parva]TFI59825.1 alpha/beta hydrolase [Sphingomonas parva]
MQHFTASDGVRISYRDEGQGRPIVALHGLMAHSGFFEPQRSLVSDFRLIRLDLRGHGGSRGDAAPTIARLAADVAELADLLDLDDAIGMGWSLGASVLWRVLAGPARRRFAGAVIIDMTPRVRNDGDWTLGLSPEHCEARSRAIAEDFTAFAAAAGAAIFAQGAGLERHPLADWASAEFARNDGEAIGALWRSLAEEDFRPLLAAIRQPTLIAHGVESHLYGADTADHLAGAIPEARAVAFEHSGHSPHLEEPELFNRTLRAFAASLPPVRQSAITA